MKKNNLDINSTLSLKSPSGGKTEAGSKIKAEKKFGLKENQVILCSNCGNAITSPQFIVTVNGHHKHTFINPGGFTYQIGCFSSTEGCVVYGDPSLENTWFKGFQWNYCLCSNCGVHLGWYYQNRDESFFGLITERLIDSTIQ